MQAYEAFIRILISLMKTLGFQNLLFVRGKPRELNPKRLKNMFNI